MKLLQTLAAAGALAAVATMTASAGDISLECTYRLHTAVTCKRNPNFSAI